jgi:hypothetical protein
MISAAGRRPSEPSGNDDQRRAARALHTPTVSMAARHAAVDAVLANMDGTHDEGTERPG